MNLKVYFFFLFILISTVVIQGQTFISVEGRHFVKGGKPYYFLGANFWYGMNLASAGEGGDRRRLLRELDHLKALGVTNLRIMAAGEGPESEPWRMKPALQTSPGVYNPALLDGLDFLLAEMGKRGMYAVVCLSNFWQWSGGMAQYRAWFEEDVEVPYPDPVTGKGWLPYMIYTSGFYKSESAMTTYESHLRTVIRRRNTYTGRLYREDPTIMAWQLANEPRGMLRPRAYRRWIVQSAKRIKELDGNHLVCIGSEGNTQTPTGNHFRKDHRSEYIDYTTIHTWVQNWGWYDPENPEESFERAKIKAKEYLDRHLNWAAQLNKPLVLEEFGISRDANSHEPTATVEWRNRFYKYVFELIHQRAEAGTPAAGSNFWAWGGEGRPREPRAVWQRGDDWIGDPPHELQGWYSVYDADVSTLAIIAAYAKKMQALSR